MAKVSNDFNGYINVDKDTFTFSVSNYIVSLLPAESNPTKIEEIFDRICSRNIELPEYLFGSSGGYSIALLRNDKFYHSLFGLDKCVRFATPIIVQSAGNVGGFFNRIANRWDEFHAITFYGGNINSIFMPQMAIDPADTQNDLSFNGVWEIKTRPWKDYTHSIDLIIDREKVNLTISVEQVGGKNNDDYLKSYSLGELNSFVRFSFENAQEFDKIEKYYLIVKSLIAILSKQKNIFFDTYLSQRNSDNQFFTTAYCKFADPYDNYSSKKYGNVISVLHIFDYIPKLVDSIVSGKCEPLLTLLPEDNRKNNQISITNIQDICTALEISYEWNKQKRKKDSLIAELKEKIKGTIKEFTELHSELDPSKQTTISSAFQYLDYTLKQKILTLYNENTDAIDAVISKWSLPQITDTNISSFVKLRNGKTHSGTIEWGENAEIYPALLALVYACLFKHLVIPDKKIKRLIQQIF